jgi:site-specific recombinase XerD
VPAGRAIAAGELAGLLNTCDQTQLGIRDAAIIAKLYAGGLLRAELVELDLADYDAGAGRVRARGKRNKVRLVPVVGGAAVALSDWLAERGSRSGPLFWGIGNRNQGGRLTTQAIYVMLQKRAKEAGIDSLSPHDFRRTFVGDLLDRGADIATVQKLAGHASVVTIACYDRRGEEAKQKAAELLHVPYQRRVLRNAD